MGNTDDSGVDNRDCGQPADVVRVKVESERAIRFDAGSHAVAQRRHAGLSNPARATRR